VPARDTHSTVSHFEPLASLQDLDTRLAQLGHRLETLPEKIALGANALATSDNEAERVEVEEQAKVLRRDQRRHEDEVGGIEDRISKASYNLYSGAVTIPKELEAVQQEIDSLVRHRGTVEDSILELMEQIEPFDNELASLDADRAAMDAEAGQLSAKIEVAEAEIGAERAVVMSDRDGIVGLAGEELVALYEKHRGSMRDRVAVGRLVGSICDACHLEMSAVEVDRIRHFDDEVAVYCEECGALLVR
jgi:predicted  nucleic acid-binding Zn-ribbon protein